MTPKKTKAKRNVAVKQSGAINENNSFPRSQSSIITFSLFNTLLFPNNPSNSTLLDTRIFSKLPVKFNFPKGKVLLPVTQCGNGIDSFENGVEACHHQPALLDVINVVNGQFTHTQTGCAVTAVRF